MKGQSNGIGVDRHLRSHCHVHVRRVDGCVWGTDGADDRQERFLRKAPGSGDSPVWMTGHAKNCCPNLCTAKLAGAQRRRSLGAAASRGFVRFYGGSAAGFGSGQATVTLSSSSHLSSFMTRPLAISLDVFCPPFLSVCFSSFSTRFLFGVLPSTVRTDSYNGLFLRVHSTNVSVPTTSRKANNHWSIPLFRLPFSIHAE